MRPEHKEEMKKRARNIRLTVAYDGTNYHGFQRQKNARAVQNVLEEALEKIFGDKIELAAAGRTDTGVHAAGQVVNFFTDGKIPTKNIARAANVLLPFDIAVKDAAEADKNFSARHSAKSKIYVYRIFCGKTRDPFTERFAWQICRPLDVSEMQKAVAHVVGEHDFSSFRATGGNDKSPVRTIYRADITETAADSLTITVHGNGFLYHMVRNIVGTLADVGTKKISADDFAAVLAAHDRQKASATAPAKGLCLARVMYDEKGVNNNG